MQKVLLTLENTKNAYLFLELINQFDFVRSIELKQNKTIELTNENEIFTKVIPDDFFLDDLQMTVKEFRLQTLQDEKKAGMTKHTCKTRIF